MNGIKIAVCAEDAETDARIGGKTDAKTDAGIDARDSVKTDAITSVAVRETAKPLLTIVQM